ncbi:hemin ABC transporter ATP-binding protein [Sporosarcina sp. P37]|uniref:ABC transporter ATP-binding protein n=1 Tax=unclassified Sporosarcina TaxID=2647733 RepID=UPI000A17F7DF|nr:MULTISPECIES: ABC transporter ATP-binding protein [unclassified Sporosarcina]ARK25032.1 hemin ABC transporter ATP-binding protein [Sporosarcina sp. P37]PID18178.1 ABC transporter ATP-binding protein [Sporosarcina sp. P35]
MSVFTIDKVKKTFSNGEVEEEILKGVNLSLKEGEITALIGPSGSGKSTILTIAAGLQKASGGEILFEGKDMTKMSQEEIRQIRASDFGFVFQSSHLVPFLTAEEQLQLMLDVSEMNLSKKEQGKAIDEMLQLVGMEHRKDAYPASLSGGERQRVAIARAIIHRPKILFADEPTASLDTKRSKGVMELLQELTRALNLTTLMVTHDEEMLPYVDRVITMRDGYIVE